MTYFSHDLAIVIGIDRYGGGIRSLQTAVNDVKVIAQRLQQDHHYQVMTLVNQQATLAALQHLIKTVLPQQVKPDSRLLFYFAGHGIALNGEDGPEGYLIPQDAKAGDTSSYLAMLALQTALSALPCRHFLGILDCCFAGAFRWSSNTRDISCDSSILYQERYDRFVRDPAWQILTSAAHDQMALDAFSLNKERGQVGEHSPFAVAFIEALEGKADVYPPAEHGQPVGDGVITATELYLYLRHRVEMATKAHTIRQTPGLFPLKQHDKGEYIFLVPGHKLNLPTAPALDAKANPYRGLEPFEPVHSNLFFGRQLLVDRLQYFVESHPLSVVLGASGAGKSSLVKAGLIPRLRSSAPDKWHILPTIRPGEHLFESLNQALSRAQLPTVDPFDGEQTLTRSIDEWAKRSPERHLLMFIDQSEEVITLCSDETERYHYFQQILTAIDAHRARLKVVLSLRSDFEPQIRDSGLKFAPGSLCEKGETELKNRWQKGRFMVPSMSRAELREAIEKPAEARVMYFEPYALVEKLIDEVADMPGALPLLSFALSELYQRYLIRQQSAYGTNEVINRTLTQSDYEKIGGVVYSLTQRANCEYERLVNQDASYDQTIKNVMLRMIATGGEMARRKVPTSELIYLEPEDRRVKQVVETFLTARLITISTDASDTIYIEPAHDALVRGWEKLLIWKVAGEEKLPLQRRLTQATNEWRQVEENNAEGGARSQQKPERFLWNNSPYLDVLKETLRSPDHGFNRVETDFVKQSIGLRQQQKRQRKRLRVIVTSAIAGFAVFASIQAIAAQFNLTTALRRSSSASFASNRYQFDALVDGLSAAGRFSLFPGNQFMSKTHAETRTALATALFWDREHNRLEQHSDVPQTVDYSPDGRLFVTGGHDNKIVVSYADGQLLKQLEGHTGAIMSVCFSPDGQTVASASQDGTVRLWQVKTGLSQIIETEGGGLFTVQFSPDGQRLITGSEDGIARIWSYDGQLLQTLAGGHSVLIRSAKFSPDARQVMTADDDGTLKLWNLNETIPKLVDSPFSVGSTEAVVKIDFSPDGKTLASASQDGTVRIWDREGRLLEELSHNMPVTSIAFDATGEILAAGTAGGEVSLWSQTGDQPLADNWRLTRGRLLDSWSAHTGYINSLEFSPDSRTLITVGNDRLTKIWQTKRNWLVSLEGHRGAVNSVQFSSDGKKIATGGRQDRTVRLWNASDRSLAGIIESPTSVHDVSFSPSADVIAWAGGDGSILLWHLEQQKLSQFRKHDGRAYSISFSPDGKTIASGGEDGIVKLWHLDGTDLVSFEKQVGEILSVRFSPDGRNIVTAGADGTVRVLDLTGSVVEELEKQTNPVQRAVFSADGRMIVSANGDDTVRLWNWESGTVISVDDDVGHRAAVLGVSFSPDGQMIASASSDRTIKLWRRNGEPIATLLGHLTEVNTVAFSPDGKHLISADFRGKVLLWDIGDISLPTLIGRGCQQIKNYINTQTEEVQSLQQICTKETPASLVD